jgi:hypothetical protein
MTDAELQRLERCKKCSKSTEADDFQGGTELYCPLHGYPCDMIMQCGYILDNNIRNLTDEETDIYNSSLEAEAKMIDGISLL